MSYDLRSAVHNTTFINGKYQRDPKGYHLTISYKNADQVEKRTHVSSHGYVTDESSLGFREATHSKEKPDSQPKRNGQPVWPPKDVLVEVMEVAYSYLGS